MRGSDGLAHDLEVVLEVFSSDVHDGHLSERGSLLVLVAQTAEVNGASEFVVQGGGWRSRKIHCVPKEKGLSNLLNSMRRYFKTDAKSSKPPRAAGTATADC